MVDCIWLCLLIEFLRLKVFIVVFLSPSVSNKFIFFGWVHQLRFRFILWDVWMAMLGCDPSWMEGHDARGPQCSAWCCAKPGQLWYPKSLHGKEVFSGMVYLVTKKQRELYRLALSREWGNQPLHWYIGDSFPHSLLRASCLKGVFFVREWFSERWVFDPSVFFSSEV